MISTTDIQTIAGRLQLNKKSVQQTLQLMEGGATIPFIARYRKELTGSLDEVQLAEIHREWKKIQELEQRKGTILKAIDEQGQLTDLLRQRIEHCTNLTELEDIYLPYKKKRQTKATVAKEKGLEPLALVLYQQVKQTGVETMASTYINEQVATVEEALQGARDIMAEWIHEDETMRNIVRRQFERDARIRAKVARGKDEEGAKYRDYFDYEEELAKCPSHRLLAIRRGEEEGFLRVSIGPDEEETRFRMEQRLIKAKGEASEQVRLALEDSYKRLLAPGIETEFRNSSKEKADAEAIKVFAENLRQLLLAAPLGQKQILGIDPGFRTGCKIVCLSPEGTLLEYTTIFPHPPQMEAQKATETLLHLVTRHRIQAIAIGNGTAGRETLSLCQGIRFETPVDVFMVNEAGASIYSASDVAREEFPEHDITVRGAVSIGRRLMDPLAELVKIDPKSIGVGQYQHDVNQGMLRDTLGQVVEFCVNSVGINVNTASKHLLTYVSGLGPVLAKNIVDFRQENGSFMSRQALKKVPRMGEKAFEQCAGFLRVRHPENPLDNTGVHPERYVLVQQMAKELGCSVPDLIQQEALRKQVDLARYVTTDVGLPTLKDIMQELAKPGLDPRGQAKTFSFDPHIRSIEDVKPGMIVPGIVNNITNFGAFVDIGVKQSGLVHISHIANKYVSNPADVLKLNQEVWVKVLEVDVSRQRIQLSIKEA